MILIFFSIFSLMKKKTLHTTTQRMVHGATRETHTAQNTHGYFSVVRRNGVQSASDPGAVLSLPVLGPEAASVICGQVTQGHTWTSSTIAERHSSCSSDTRIEPALTAIGVYKQRVIQSCVGPEKLGNVLIRKDEYVSRLLGLVI